MDGVAALAHKTVDLTTAVSALRGFADEPGRFDPDRGDDDLAADRFDRQRGPDFEADDDGPRSAPPFNRRTRLARFDDDDEDRD